MFPALYDMHHNLNAEDIPYWLSLAGQSDSPILELGCGTGRVLLPLVQAGFHVFGLDTDAGMLRQLQHKLSVLKASGILPGKTDFWQADLTCFHLARSFSLILLPCNTYTTLDSEQRKAALLAVHRHLTDRGLFVFSAPNPSVLQRMPAHGAPEVEDSFSHPFDGEPVQVSSEWRRIGQRFNLTWIYDHLLPDGQVERLKIETVHDLASSETHLQEIQQAGLERVAMYGDFDRSPYDRTAPYLILELRRRSG